MNYCIIPIDTKLMCACTELGEEGYANLDEHEKIKRYLLQEKAEIEAEY